MLWRALRPGRHSASRGVSPRIAPQRAVPCQARRSNAWSKTSSKRVMRRSVLTVAFAAASAASRQKFRWDGVRRVLVEPDRRRDPPTLPVPEELQRVDAAPLDRALRGAPLLVR